MSIFDWTASLLGAWLLGRWLGLHSPKAWVLFLVAWVGFGVAAHLVAGVPTELGYKLGLNGPPVREACR